MTLGHLWHLVRRFLGMLVPRGPAAADEVWVASVLGEGEQRLWGQMAPSDRRHAAAVARRVERALGLEATPPVLAAALLHDVGKIDARLGPYGRAVATACGMVASPGVVQGWMHRRGFTRRVALYLSHPAIGGDMLALAGSDPLTVSWAREHHLPPEQWSVLRPLADALKGADDD